MRIGQLDEKSQRATNGTNDRLLSKLGWQTNTVGDGSYSVEDDDGPDFELQSLK